MKSEVYIRTSNYLSKWIVILLAFYTINGFGQDVTKIESYLKTISLGKQDTTTINAYNELATEFLGNSDEKAKEYATKGLQLGKKLNQAKHQSWSLNLIGMSYDYLGKPDSALYFYYESIKLKAALNDLDGLGAVYMNIGVLYYYQNDIKNALSNYDIALEFYIKSNNLSKVAGILNNKAILFREEKKYAEALEVFNQSLKIKNELKDTIGIANALGNIGVVNQYLGNYELAEEYYKKSLFFDSIISNHYNLVSSYLSLAELHLIEKHFNETKKYLDQSIVLGEKIKAIHYLDDAFKLYAVYDSIMGDFEMAFYHQKKAQYYANEVANEERIQQMDKLNVLYKTEEKEQAITNLKAQTELDQLKISSKNTQLALMIALFILLLVASFYMVYIYRKINQNRKELDQKNKIISHSLEEKEVLLKEIHHRVKNNLQVISSLLNLQSRYIKDSRAIEAINESKERINAISLLHKEIYQNEVLKEIHTKNYFENLIDTIQNTFDPDKRIQLLLDIEDIHLDIDTLIPLGLIVNEIFTNCYKYGTTQDNPQFVFTFKKRDSQIYLIVKDNGKGFPVGMNSENIDSLGLKLISLFSKKLQAELNYTSNGGAQVEISFKFVK